MKKEIVDIFMFRHACKKFDPERRIGREEFETILEAGRLSPSSFGFEPWKFLVVQDMKLREKLLSVSWGAQGQYPTASHVILCLVKKSFFMRYDRPYIWDIMTRVHKLPEDMARARRDKYEKFQRHDFRLLASERAMEDWAGKQSYIAMANMMTAAAMMNVDSCPIEGYDKAALEDILASDFGVDLEKFAMGWGLAFGYRVKQPRKKTRLPREEVIEWFGGETD